MKRPTSEKLQLLRAHYTAGSRVRLLQMDDPYRPDLKAGAMVGFRAAPKGACNLWKPLAGDRRALSREFPTNSGVGVSARPDIKKPPLEDGRRRNREYESEHADHAD